MFYDMSNLEIDSLDDINRICYDFKYNSSKNAYLTLSMCIAVFRKMCSIYECSVFTDEDFQDWSDSVYNTISDSEYFNDEKIIVEEFAYELNYLINEDEI